MDQRLQENPETEWVFMDFGDIPFHLFLRLRSAKTGMASDQRYLLVQAQRRAELGVSDVHGEP